ncbi:hypothetical protein [Ochrobactrum sp. MYb379]|uniref:hypothetical protein n=1 Tax=Ochrobactrum sp. MYb379 TaxID=2745275 RepID=UPI0030A10662
MAESYKPWENISSDNADDFIQKFDDFGGPELAISIGRVIISWSQLEGALQSFLMELLSIRIDHFLATVGQLDIYQKIDAIASITLLDSPDPRWTKHLTELKKYIHGNLREERNRLAHDYWINEPDNKQAIRFKPTIDKKTNKPNYITSRDVSNDELRVLAARIMSCFAMVHRLRDLYFPGRPKPWQQK